MKLVQRMWLLGAVIPAVAMMLMLLGTGQVFRLALERSLDQALLAQAAVESVSLFDGPLNEPHLHMASSPLVEQVRPFAPTGSLFGPDGRLVARYPAPLSDEERAERQPPGHPDAPPEVSTRRGIAGERLREVQLTVATGSGQRYTLRLSASMAQLDRSVRTFHLVAFALAGLAVLLLVFLDGWQAGKLAGRLRALTGHIARMREGELDRPPPEDRSGDEIAALRDVLADAAERLHQARTAQERLIADAAHELRTPLTVMRTGMDLALRRERTADELREELGEARKEVDRLAALAGRLLDLAALSQAGWDRTRGDLAGLVEESAEALRGTAEERAVLIHLEVERPAQAIFHAPSLRQAVDNLLANALKFSPRGGEVAARLARQGGDWLLTIRDRGPGIAAEHREAVFAPFHRLPAAQPGAGLGLAIVRDVATRHGGRVWVEEAPGGGAALVLLLPAGPR